jgi:membrane protease YdiL (CAAX protease family)
MTLSKQSAAMDFAVFLLGAVLQYVTVYLAVPHVTTRGVEPIVAWMLCSVPMIFMPLIMCGLWMLRTEDSLSHWRRRLRLSWPHGRDWLWGAGGLGCIVLGSGFAFWLCSAIGLESNPPFARDVQAVTRARLWLVALWAIYWPINMLGEEFIWRGVLLPRMSLHFGRHAWLVNAVMWGLFHAAFGVGNVVVLVPTLLVVPLIAQLRRSTWLAVMLHAGLSLPGFVALGLGAAP